MNRKGFILSTYVYILLTFFLLILGTTLVVLNNTKMLAKKIKEESFNKSGIDSNFSLVLNGDKEMKLYQGEEFIDPGYIAQNIKGEALEAVINSNVDINNVGDYIVVYTITYNGETKSVTRKVKVEKFIKNFEYTGDVQEFVVPVTGIYQIELWGAQGGDAQYTAQYYGGKGAYTSGKILLTKNETIYLYVGGQGASVMGTSSFTVTNNGNGYNGGTPPTSAASNSTGGGGGGATDIRFRNNDLKDRIMVAGGGGGAKSHTGTPSYSGSGGVGGSLIGGNAIEANSTCYAYGKGGSQVEGGSSITCATDGHPSPGIASFGKGYSPYTVYNTTSAYAGGGSGYYGGGAGYHAAAGGGSSFISGYTGCVAVTSEGTPKSGCTDGTTDTSCSIHFSGKIFTDSVMIAGDASMSTHDGTSTMTGNEGNGYAKITYVDE